MAGVFSRGKASRGFKAAEQENKKREEARERKMGKLFRLFLNEGEEDVPARFLTEQPILFYEHTIKNGNSYDHYPCTQDDSCEHCEDGSKASYKGAWLVTDGRPYEKAVYKDGKKTDKKVTVTDQIRLYVRGQTDVAKMASKSKKFGLTKRPWFISRVGSGQSTSYDLERGEEDPLTKSQLKKLIEQLPEPYREMFDPKDPEESLLDIVEAQIFGLESDDTDDDDDDDNDTDDSSEEDEDLDEGVMSLEGEEDEDEDEEPKTKKPLRSSGKSPAKAPSKPKPKLGVKKPASSAAKAPAKKPGLRKPKR